MSHTAKWWTGLPDGRVLCELCPRNCKIGEGLRGFCYVRKVENGKLILDTYGRSSGFCIDPIEKKPLNHFFPGTSVLSFGTAGCNLGCRFCQNWNISKSRSDDALMQKASPARIAEVALEEGCASVAFTYNDPVIFAEYAIDVAEECRKVGIHPVAVTAGYINPEPAVEFFGAMDAANVDLKAFTEGFYKKQCFAALAPVLKTLKFIKNETDVWFEVTTLLIPEENDSDDEIRKLSAWCAENLGTMTPLHFTAFHPDFKLDYRPKTPKSTLIRARKIAMEEGMKFVYIGNVVDEEGHATYCPCCNATAIARDYYDVREYNLVDGCCASCGCKIAGRFAESQGSWGNRRQRVAV
ncbi:MAG: AmmeMemoRadiSam system radical SAM enzyme [Planctomycetes bacterium]|nr:AmmeMemoRadiSam system radical SAM enzyme [Planctomycetota bacterium]